MDGAEVAGGDNFDMQIEQNKTNSTLMNGDSGIDMTEKTLANNVGPVDKSGNFYT